jgi:predicted cupin superfamily sugar epimerase
MTDDALNPGLREIIETFAMERHHTAGWISPHYSDSEIWGRSKLSSMYYLLSGDEPMPLHKLDGVEVWHYYMGAPAEFTVTNGSRLHEVSLLGRDLAAGQRPQLAVPAYVWQSCRSLGDWTLLGCTMSPGYSPRATFVMDAEG